MAEYKSLLRVVSLNGEVALSEELQSFELEERIEHLQMLFVISRNNYSLGTAEKYFNYLMQSVDDCYLLRLAESNGDTLQLAENETTQELAKGALAEKARLCMELYKHNCENSPRRSMVEVMVEAWARVVNENLADAIFRFLVKIPRSVGDSDLVGETIRRKTDSTFSIPRLMRSVCLLLEPGESLSSQEVGTVNILLESPFLSGREEEMIKILLHALVKRTSFSGATDWIAILRILLGSSGPALKAIAEASERISQRDANVKVLLEDLNNTFGDRIRVEVSYSPELHITICVTVFANTNDNDSGIIERTVRRIVEKWQEGLYSHAILTVETAT